MVHEVDFYDRDIDVIDKLTLCLKAMNYGLSIQIGEETFKVAETSDCKGFQVMYKREQYTIKDGKKTNEKIVWLGMDVSDFCYYVKQMTEEERLTISANTTLREINRTKREYCGHR